MFKTADLRRVLVWKVSVSTINFFSKKMETILASNIQSTFVKEICAITRLKIVALMQITN